MLYFFCRWGTSRLKKNSPKIQSILYIIGGKHEREI